MDTRDDAFRPAAADPTSPWGPRDGRRPASAAGPAGPAAREPVLSRRRWPWSDLLLIGLIAGGFIAQLFGPPAWTADLALSAQGLREGHLASLVGHIFLHAGIVHILFNLSAYMGLAGPVHVALRGRGPDTARSGGVYLLLFLASGLAGAAAFVLANYNSPIPAVGASGAICGLWGAASRVATPDGELLPLRHPHVGKNARNFLVMNLVLVLLVWGLNAMAGQGATGMSGIAWEAHFGGYLIGLLLLPAFQKLARGRVLRFGGAPG